MKSHSTATIIYGLFQQVLSGDLRWTPSPTIWPSWNWVDLMVALGDYPAASAWYINGVTTTYNAHNVIVLGDDEGERLPYLDGNPAHEIGAFQIRVRGIPYAQHPPRNAAIAAGIILDTVHRLPLSYESTSYLVHSATRQQAEPLPIRQDQQHRWEWVLNYRTTITQE